ncbi:peptidase A4 family-domain-containing protein [Boletus edulis]|nr:peptidase A4 family-domain-containing protein [Boletus edulis]
MHLNSAFISGVLFASAVLAGHPGETQSLSHVNQSYTNGGPGRFYSSDIWAGAFLQDKNGTFYFASGTFRAPTVSGRNDSGITIRVSIDGAKVATGIDVFVRNNETSYEAWSLFSGTYRQFSNFFISASDVIRANVTVFPPISVTATLENLSSGQTVVNQLNSTFALSQQYAEWAIKDRLSDSSTTDMSLPNFGSVNFTDAVACCTETHTLAGAYIIEMRQQDNDLTYTTVDETSITIEQV